MHQAQYKVLKPLSKSLNKVCKRMIIYDNNVSFKTVYYKNKPHFIPAKDTNRISFLQLDSLHQCIVYFASFFSFFSSLISFSPTRTRNNHSLRRSLILPSVLPLLLVVFAQLSASTWFWSQTAIQPFLAPSNYPTLALQRAESSAGRFKTMHSIARLRRILSSSSPSECMKLSFHFPISISPILARKVKSHQQLAKMHPSDYYLWDIQAMISQSTVTSFAGKLSWPSSVKEEVTLLPIAPSEGTFQTTDMAVRLTKFDVAHYGLENILLRVNQSADPEIALGDISEFLVLFCTILRCVQVFLREENFLRQDHRRGELFQEERWSPISHPRPSGWIQVRDFPG